MNLLPSLSPSPVTAPLTTPIPAGFVRLLASHGVRFANESEGQTVLRGLPHGQLTEYDTRWPDEARTTEHQSAQQAAAAAWAHVLASAVWVAGQKADTAYARWAHTNRRREDEDEAAEFRQRAEAAAAKEPAYEAAR